MAGKQIKPIVPMSLSGQFTYDGVGGPEDGTSVWIDNIQGVTVQR
jgi:hypothetical protein